MSKIPCSLAALLLSATCLVSCGPTTQTVVAAVDRPGQPWPSDVPRCAILRLDEVSPCTKGLSIFLDQSGSSPIAVIERPAQVDLTWRELPVIGQGDRAKVDVFSPLLFSGWASLGEASFSLTGDVDIRAKQLGIKSGAAVSLVGTSSDKVIVRIPTSLKTPDAFEVAVECRLLRYGDSTQRPPALKTAQGYVIARKNTPIALRTAPEGPTFFVFEPTPSQAFRFLGQREDSIRIGGIEPGKLLFDGWADLERFYTLEKRPPINNGSGCGRKSTGTSQPANLVETRRDAMLYYGQHPPGQHFATVKIGTPIRIEEELGDRVAVSFADRIIHPPRGLRYFMKREATRDCHDGGCPASEE